MTMIPYASRNTKKLLGYWNILRNGSLSLVPGTEMSETLGIS